MSSFPLLDAFIAFVPGIFGDVNIWLIFLAIMIYLIFGGLMKLDNINSLALASMPLVIYNIFNIVSVGWYAGVAVLIYGFILYGSLKKLFSLL